MARQPYCDVVGFLLAAARLFEHVLIEPLADKFARESTGVLALHKKMRSVLAQHREPRWQFFWVFAGDHCLFKLLKNGLYDFDADHKQIRVFKGTGQVHTKGQNIKLTGEREFALDGGKLKAQTFDTRQYEDDFFRWSALRSGYLSEATVDQARLYIGPGPTWYGPGWYGTGWYWDPWFGVWTFIPEGGIFYSPFGWGFYSPIFVYRSPFFFYGYYGHQPHYFNEFHYPYGHGFEPPGGFRGGGFH